MKIARIREVYWSATDTTKTVVHTIAAHIAQALQLPLSTDDWTLPAARENTLTFAADELVIFGTPVYAGRVPNVLMPYVRDKVVGNGALAVPVVLYGNRNFDDGLIELRNQLEANGLHTIAAGAFIGEHSFSYILGKGRPDADDLAKAHELAELTLARLEKLDTAPTAPVEVKGCDPIRPYYTPRDRAGNPVNILKVKPKFDLDKCTNCGLCAQVCPMGSIVPGKVGEFSGICIKCCACYKKCPTQAVYFDDAGYLYHQHELEEGYARRAEPEIF